MSDDGPILGDLYVYKPNKIAPIAFTVLFAASAVGHIIQCQHYREWKLIGLHPLCAVLFTLAYALRAYGAFDHFLYLGDAKDLGNLIVFILSQVFIFVSPPLLELANYHVLGRILYYVPFLAPIPPGKVLLTFGLIMMITELVNALGVALSANPTGSTSTQSLGEDLMRAALALQLAVILTFVAIAGEFHRRLYKSGLKPKRIMTPIYVLYISMLLILVRCIYRLVERVGHTAVRITDQEALNNLTPLLRHEWWFWVFEATLMFLNSVLWNIWTPGRFLPKDYHTYLSKDGVTEITDEGDKDTRKWWEKFLHVFTFGLLFHRKTMKSRESEMDGEATDERQSWEKFLNVFTFGILFRRKKTRSQRHEMAHWRHSGASTEPFRDREMQQ